MTDLSRRTFMAAAAAVPLLGACRVHAATAARIALYDPTLAAGSQFASRARELGLEAIPLEQDRVRLLRRILAGKPVSLWGVSRHADQLLANGIMREHGYRAQLALRHQGYQPITPGCGQASRMAAAMSRVASDQWPIAFAEMAAGRSSLCEASQREKMDRATICWSFTLAGGA